MKGTQHLLLGLFLLLAACSMLTVLSCSDSPEGPDDDPALSQVLTLNAELKSAGVHLVWNRLDRALCSNYLLQRSTTPNSGFETIDTIDAFIFACVDKNLIANATYYYRMVALDNTHQQTVTSNLDTVQITGSCQCLSETIWLSGHTGGESQLIYVLNSTNPALFDWTAAEAVDWFSITSSSGVSGGGFCVNAQANATDFNRTGLVIISANEIGDSPDTLVVAQATRGGILCPSTNEIYVRPLGGINAEVTVGSCAGIPTVSWVAESNADWLTVQTAAGATPGGLSLLAGVNYTGADRSCIVTVRPDGFDEPPDTIIVRQRRPFADAVDYSASGTPSSICGADFNGDGYVDVAAVFEDQAYVSIYSNNGNGTLAAASDQATLMGAKWIRAADFDGDGYRDLVTVSTDGTTITVLINSGTGSFSATGLPALTNLGRVTPVDCDGDGDVDIVTTNRETNRVLIFANNGSGVFGTPVSVAVGRSPEAVCAGNINAIGNLDLITANSVGDNASLLINSLGLTYMGAVNFLVQDNPVSICASDFTGDNRVDVAVACSGTSRVCLLKNTGKTGTSRFTTGGNLDVVQVPTSVCASNLDGDGDVDLVVSGVGTSVMVNTGLGVFATALNLDAFGENIVDVSAEDYDGDGDKDLAVANQTAGVVTIYINNTY